MISNTAPLAQDMTFLVKTSQARTHSPTLEALIILIDLKVRPTLNLFSQSTKYAPRGHRHQGRLYLTGQDENGRITDACIEIYSGCGLNLAELSQ